MADETAPKPHWTVMVYMVADTGDSFYQAAMNDIEEMTRAKFDDRVKVVVHADAPAPWPKQCWEVKGATDGKSGTADPLHLEALCLVDFVDHCVKKFPAERYLLVLWGHGEGIDWKEKVVAGDQLSAGIPRAGKRFGAGSQGVLEVAELGKVLERLTSELNARFQEKFTKERVVVGFDACLMGMVEVYYEIKDYVSWVVAPNDEIPDTGWPYEDILNVLGDNPNTTPRGLAEKIVEKCKESYSKENDKSDVSFSACRLENSEGVKSTVAELTEKLNEFVVKEDGFAVITKARDFAEDLKEKAYVDLYAFCTELKRRAEKANLPDLHEAADKVATKVNELVVEKGFSDEYPWKYKEDSRAVSICFPESANLEGSLPGFEVELQSYKGLRFSESGWPKFLETFWAQSRSK